MKLPTDKTALLVLLVCTPMFGAADPNLQSPHSAASGAIKLLVVDETGNSLPQPAVIFDGKSAELSMPITETDGESTVSVPAGRYWVSWAEAVEEFSELTTVRPGETNTVLIKIPRSIWLTFCRSNNPPSHRKQLLALRPPQEVRQHLVHFRDWESHAPAVLRADATEADMSKARKLAMTEWLDALERWEPPKEADAEQVRLFRATRDLNLSLAQRIFAIAGTLEDVEGIFKSPYGQSFAGLQLIGWIEARHEKLSIGRLIEVARGTKATRSDAAIVLSRLGLRGGAKLLRDQTKTINAASAALLLDDLDPETLGAMRTNIMKVAAWKTRALDYDRNVIPASLYLLAHGNMDDWKMVSSLRFGVGQQSFFVGVADNPAQFAQPVVANRNYILISEILQRMSDRTARDSLAIRRRVNDAMAEAEVALLRGSPTASRVTSLTTSSVLQSSWMPDVDAVRLFGGFRRTKKLGPQDGGLYTTWMSMPEHVDHYVNEWLGGKMGFLPHLEYVETTALSDAVARLGNGRKPPAYDLYMAYKRIGHRQRVVVNPLPMGQRRWPYVAAFHEKGSSGNQEYGGGISGVATLAASFSGSTLILKLRLEQRVHYESSGAFLNIGGREKREEWPHHRYATNYGLQLIEKIVVRRGNRQFVADEVGREDGAFLFEAKLDSDSQADLWVDIEMGFMDQSWTLTECLYLGEVARELRLARNQSKPNRQ